jgi:HSP20 family protein
MAEVATKLPVKNEARNAPARTEFAPFSNLRREMDRLFDEFAWNPWRMPRSLFDADPFCRTEASLAKVPAVDIADTDKAYETRHG